MMPTVVVPGRPVPKGRPRLGVRGRGVYVYTPPETVAYERTVGWCAKSVFRQPLHGPVQLRVVLYLRGKRTPDLTNLVKSIEDGLNKIAYDDDAQVKRVVAEICEVHRRDEERAEIEITPYQPEQLAEGA